MIRNFRATRAALSTINRGVYSNVCRRLAPEKKKKPHKSVGLSGESTRNGQARSRASFTACKLHGRFPDVKARGARRSRDRRPTWRTRFGKSRGSSADGAPSTCDLCTVGFRAGSALNTFSIRSGSKKSRRSRDYTALTKRRRSSFRARAPSGHPHAS